MTSGDNLNASRIALKLSTLLPERKGGSVVLVTSATQGEGKSFASRLLAGEMSQSLGVDLILVDASRTQDRGGPPSGFSRLMADGEFSMATPGSGSMAQVRFLSSGLGLAGALFNVAGVERGFDALRAHCKLALIDGPPLSECGAMLLHADAIVLVVDSRRTPLESVQGALASVQLDSSRVAGVLLNRATPQKQ